MATPPCCAECEVATATLTCEDEGLCYCNSCSQGLHAKKARVHHVLKPIPICDECEIAVALFACVHCGGRSDALLFCSACSSKLHAKKARAHHKLERIPQSHSSASPAVVSSLNKNYQKSSTSPEAAGSTQDLDRKERCPRFGKENTEVPPSKEVVKDLPTFNNSHQSSSVRAKPCKKDANENRATDKKPARNSLKTSSSENKENRCAAPRRSSRKRSINDEPNASSDITSSSGEEDTSEDDESYGTKKYTKGSVTLEAFVVDVQDHEEGYPGARLEVNEDQPEDGIQNRIRKMLELGLHPETPDIEAQQALKNAQRLLTKHNLQKADVLKGGLEANKHAFKAGMRIVELRSKDKLKPGRFEHWVYSLALIVSKYFDTQYFAQKHLVLKVVFYGIKQNVDCAGYAFAATFNRISKLSADYHPSKHENYKKARKTPLSNSTFSRVSRMSYRNGLVEGLFETVKSRKLHQKMNTKFGGMKSSELGKDSTAPCERDRLRLNRSDEDCWPDDAYNDCSGNEASSTEATRFDDEDDDICGVWSTDQSAVLGALVLHSKKIGDDLLKERKIKVANRRQESPIIWDGEAFLKGKRDSRTIDLGQKGITAKARKTAAV